MTATRPTTPLAASDQAPDFTLASTAGGEVTLSELTGAGRVLVAFFPLAFTGVCTTEMCAFSEDFDQFAEAGVTILPISVDAVPSLAEFKSKYNMKVDILSDFRRQASQAFGVLREDTHFSNRAYFLIDTDGAISWAHVEESPGQRRENSEILSAIQSIVS